MAKAGKGKKKGKGKQTFPPKDKSKDKTGY